ncbi:MAG TPA: UDP-N-acetylglucosamine 1-carboxyvinyltransferase [Candidatus Goldiibacteriota bacterium]|nr:UDP-N-acetylglucosamine 1-carboxyvinyltransferase [Candidatus Goldiibacteriota bacterium]
MKKFIIHGGRKLRGTVKVSGSKNATLPIMAASILADAPCVISDIPLVQDIKTMGKLLGELGARVEYTDKNVKIDTNKINNYKAPYELVKTMRASIYVLGPLLAKYGNAVVSMPGGCAIGLRPVDLHLKGLEKLGAKIKIEHGYIIAKAKKLTGATIVFDKISLGATINVMLAATMADGTTILKNASKEPEVIDTINFLNAIGANVHGAGTDTLTITGVKKLNGIDSYSVIPDRIEAATLIAAAVITNGNVTVERLKPEQLTLFFEKLKDTGSKFNIENSRVFIYPYKNRLKSVDIITEPYPGFPTDVQAQWMALMSIATGRTIIKETIWENRFMHAFELGRMGADIKIDGNTAIITGVKKLTGANVMASDLRASAALIIAALAADGITEIRRVYHLDRGYENLDQKLAMLGAEINVVNEGSL